MTEDVERIPEDVERIPEDVEKQPKYIEKIPATVQHALIMFSAMNSYLSWDDLLPSTKEEIVRLAKLLRQLTIRQLKALHEVLARKKYTTENESRKVLRENISVSLLCAFLMNERRPGRVRSAARGASLTAIGFLLAHKSQKPGFLIMKILMSLLSSSFIMNGAQTIYRVLTKRSDKSFERVKNFVMNDELTKLQTKDDVEEFQKCSIHCTRLDEEECELDEDCQWFAPSTCKPSSLKTIFHSKPRKKERNTNELEMVDTNWQGVDIEYLRKHLQSKVDTLLERGDLDQDHIKMLLRDFGVRFSDADSLIKLQMKLRKFMELVANEWLPDDEGKQASWISAGIISYGSPMTVARYLSDHHDLTMPPKLLFAMALATGIFGAWFTRRRILQASKYRLGADDIDRILRRNKIDEWFKRKPDANIYSDFIRKCDKPGACNESDATCQKDLSGRCSPNTRLQVLYRPSKYDDDMERRDTLKSKATPTAT